MTAAIYGVGAVALVWLLMCAWLWAFQESIIFYPRGLNPEASSISSYELSATTADGTKIAGWLLPAPEAGAPAKAVLFFGGNAMEISAILIEHQRKLGLAAAGFNYRGYGESEGEPSHASLRADALQAFDVAVEKSQIAPRDWIVVGASLGSHMAAYVAAKREVGAAVLVTPYDSLIALGQRRYPLFPVRLMARHPFDTAALTGEIAAPTLIVRAASDWTVPAWSTDSLVAGWRGDAPLSDVTVAGSRHNDINHHAAYWQALREFIAGL